ncbi:RmlD substrate binding domain protein [Roseovarius sp. THAF9]|uniref:NAD-dependent epimerase/dehydratase family protein n=1 Tax=Roseovarius sp. THAF9 TaxID=2587847 RepID=UPI001267E084|nr:NAD-dependent epimerase/dehydratase family protein [Roseovarius sp. THAF9]QFT93074.1 RmlD substrate binding domain protein [Roseovarius sp. THAF9]
MRILITGSGERLGRLLYAARERDDAPGAEIQSRNAGRDVQWQPGATAARLPDCDALVALWGATSGSAEELAVNARLVALSRQVAQGCGARVVFHLSSAAVYGPGARLAETARIAPRTRYGAAKVEMERRVREGRASARECVLRLANVVGADSLAGALTSDGTVTLDRFDGGRGPVRSYIGATDLLRVLRALAEAEADNLHFALNIAAPAPVAMDDLARAAGKRVAWRTAPAEAVQEVSLDTGLLQSVLPTLRLTSDADELIAGLTALERVA